ncbi:hypothetical protein [Nodosilinea sp. E11]|uniref:hypothetical protein n=1 Tax=Nodosilinea sp. E11 TaxID=3037479 RepID=UPI0029342F82|nr:hypothetical protein [Nodosilinea sp. E11]WOD37016.1 hypothetical protein RRF56_00710 [Nodosilinea sp. E11]
MKVMRQVAIGGLSAAVLLVGAAVVQAGGWDNFKLQYYSLTRIFHDQGRELGDLRKQNVDPEATTRIDLTQLLDGGPPKDGIPRACFKTFWHNGSSTRELLNCDDSSTSASPSSG